MGKPSEADVSVELDEEAVRAKAHQLWVERGCPEGTSDEDWYEAERILRESGQAAGPAEAPAEPEPASDPRPEPEPAGDPESEPPKRTRSSKPARAKRTSSSPPSSSRRSSKAGSSTTKAKTRKR